MRHLHENARAVAGVMFATAGAAMAQIDQDRESLTDDFMGLFALDINDKTDPARVMLELRVVQTLLGRQTQKFAVWRLIRSFDDIHHY